MNSGVEQATRKLLAYCRQNDWAGHDPYDALNSGLFKALRILDSRIPRLALTQILKRSPINIRSMALVPKTQNPKALALFLRALLKLPDSVIDRNEDGRESSRKDLVRYIIDRLTALRSPGISYSAWGYSFPWQGRSCQAKAAFLTHSPKFIPAGFSAAPNP